MIFRLEAVPESTVRRYFLQVPTLLNSLVSGFTLRFSNTVSECIYALRFTESGGVHKYFGDFIWENTMQYLFTSPPHVNHDGLMMGDGA